MSFSSQKFAGSGQLPTEHRKMKEAVLLLNRALAAFGSAIASVGTSLKVARMASVLSDLTDQQLAEIGVQRQDIMRHAEHLVTSGSDGL